MENERTYSDQQVKDILMKAVDLQQQRALDGSPDPNGLTREQLVKMAAELGIDPKYLDAAIDQARVSQKEDKGTWILGIPFAHKHQAVVDGELDPERFDVVVPELGNPGLNQHVSASSQVGRSLNARVQKGFAFGPLTVVSRDGKTRIDGRHVAFVGFMLGMYPALIGALLTGATLAKQGNPLFGLGAALAFLLAGTGLFGWMARKADQAMKEVVARVASVVAEETKAQGVRENLARSTSVVSDTGAQIEDRA